MAGTQLVLPVQKNHYYIFDPGIGVAQLSLLRLAESVNGLLAKAVMGKNPQGSWADYVFYYAVDIPTAGFKGLRKY